MTIPSIVKFSDWDETASTLSRLLINVELDNGKTYEEAVLSIRTSPFQLATDDGDVQVSVPLDLIDTLWE